MVRATALYICVLVAVVSGCGGLPPRGPIAREEALPVARYGSLADVVGRIEAMLPRGESAHWLLDRSELALETRLALADEAAVSLDIQYFVWQSDATGHLLASRVVAAAERGVRVRILVDDFGVAGRGGDVLMLDAHSNIQVRVFNPWVLRGKRWGTAVEFLTRAYELNRRMHNKTFTADGRLAILGGRNIGDRYFGIYERFVQNDLDVMVAGPAAREITTTFDTYWNSEHSLPIGLFARDQRPRRPIAVTNAALDASIAASAGTLAGFPQSSTDWSRYLEELVDTFVPARAEIVWESPEILDAARARLYADYRALIAGARSEVLISSPYFIPDADFRSLLRDLTARGVRVVVVTNSLATNNHIVAHSGYRRWRRDVLASGVELYEVRFDAATVAEHAVPPVMPGGLGLHTKAVVVDRERAFVGSPNVDPRSMVLNTEIGVLSEGAQFADRVRALIERDIAPNNAWRVTLTEDGWLRWQNDEETLRRQPAKGFGQRALEFLLNLLPIKDQA